MVKLSHYKESGEVRMVDVTAKPVTSRTAVARGFVAMNAQTARAIAEIAGEKQNRRGGRARKRAQQTAPLRKGNPLEIARVAGIAAAKRTSELIPLCHPLPLTHIDVTARLCKNNRAGAAKNGIEITARVTAAAQTGVEMEALVAVSVAALTVYDMCKALDKEMEITGIVLEEKIGGKSGHYRRAPQTRKRGRR